MLTKKLNDVAVDEDFAARLQDMADFRRLNPLEWTGQTKRKNYFNAISEESGLDFSVFGDPDLNGPSSKDVVSFSDELIQETPESFIYDAISSEEPPRQAWVYPESDDQNFTPESDWERECFDLEVSLLGW